eukprot:1366453-Pleurochrysis_carterae.AAC.3
MKIRGERSAGGVAMTWCDSLTARVSLSQCVRCPECKLDSESVLEEVGRCSCLARVQLSEEVSLCESEGRTMAELSLGGDRW